MANDKPQPGTLRFAIGSIPIAITPMFWIVNLMIGMQGGAESWLLAEWVGVVLVSVLVHELGHAVMALAYGRTVKIELHAMGGTATHYGTEVGRLGSALISLAGPIAGIGFGALVYYANRWRPPTDPLLVHAVGDALWVNWGYGLLNLLPILPLDGGNVMQQIVDAISRRKNDVAGAIVSLVFALGLLAYALSTGVRALLFLLAWIALMQVTRAVSLYNEWRDRQLNDELEQLSALFPTGDGPALQKLAESLLERAHGSRVKARAVQALVWSFIYQYDLPNAVNALLAMPSDYKQDTTLMTWLQGHVHAPDRDLATSELLMPLFLERKQLDSAIKLVRSRPPTAFSRTMLHELSAALFYADRFRDSLEVSDLLAGVFRSCRGAFNAACALVRLGDLDGAMTWLARAVELGEADAELALADEDLAPLRDRPRFSELIEGIKANAARRASTAN